MKAKVGKKIAPKKSVKLAESKNNDLANMDADDFLGQDFDDSDEEEMLDDDASGSEDQLDYDISGNENSSDDEDNFHVPNTDLEIASDDSDFEAEVDEDDDDEATVSENGPSKITLKLLKKWEEDLVTDSSSKTIKCVVDAFHAALVTISNPDDAKTVYYKVEGSSVFNGVVQLCILHLSTAFKKFLNIKNTKFEAHKSKKFSKIKGVIKSYLTDLIKILQNVSSSDILTVLLKHLHQMIPYAQSYTSLNKPLLKMLLKFWSTGEENVRVVSFLSIIKIATTRKESILDNLLKTMYIKYVENSKFVSQNTLPGINFMRHSLAEVYYLDDYLAYNHAFLYIRQLAIHLRNAMTLKKKDNFQAVYNWQFVNSLRFWSELVMKSRKDSMLQTLLYPLVQIITATIKLIPTAQFYPLRFHCAQMLINISKETGKFIPILPYLLEVLNTYDFNKKHKIVSMKPMSFMCLLRMSKAQLQENGFKDAVIENIYQLILECGSKDSHNIDFSDIYIPCIMELKSFLKKCKVANFSRKIKQLLEKIIENRQFIETERNKIIIDLSDMTLISCWENNIKKQGTPLKIFYDSWFKLHQTHKLKLLTQNDQDDYSHIPGMKKSRKRNEPDHDSDLDMPVEEMNKLLKKQEEKKKLKKLKKQKIHHDNNDEEEELPKDNNDVVQNTNIDDWD